ncbi:MAG TPA: hypothetical protein VHF70_00220 [Rubrobacteraceae bacterium]|nr:hypothetical protein [Rubrobacteraceae bacterium]
MEAHDVRSGMTVRVREDSRRPELEGVLGTVQKSYGAPEYLAVDVLLDDGQLELFWFHQLDAISADQPTLSAQFYDGG